MHSERFEVDGPKFSQKLDATIPHVWLELPPTVIACIVTTLLQAYKNMMGFV
jgi:hypothetical protein